MLSRARGAGFAVNPISLSDLLAYLALAGVHNEEERWEYLYFIQEMDAEFLEWVGKKKGS
ncbi:MAG: hypothetical protein LBR71_00750 [Synergistaceae bacterium]|nr:hypothetical protein [Synergistaceae bacterium]